MNRFINKAFTLIEMLVVVAVLMVLSALLLPALGGVRERARAVKCAANLKQLHVATVNYAIGGSLPRSRSTDSYNEETGIYTHNAGWVSLCAWTNGHQQTSAHTNSSYGWRTSDSGLATITNGTMYTLLRGDRGTYLCPTHALKSECGVTDAVRSYSMNSALHEANVFGVANPVNTILFGDSSTTSSEFTTNQVRKTHTGKGNVVFMDGHVECM